MIEKKEVLTLSEIESSLDKIKDLDKNKELKEKISFLKKFYKDDEYKDIRTELVEKLGKLITDPKNSQVEYKLIYDSLNEGLEPIYYWMLDFMRDTKPGGLGLDVDKGSELFEASVSSGYFGEMGQRLSLMQQKTMEYMGVINNLIKSILNIIYDLKEFEIRIKSYDDMKSNKQEERESASKSLKGIWMDQVDAKKGRASINLLAQDLTFVTLRDAFFYVNNVDEVDKLDLNLRVKNILKRKIVEYNSWVDYSEKEIKKRYNIEKIYLRSQYGTIKLYANWVKPYLLAAQKLKIHDFKTSSGLPSPDVIGSFSNMQMELSLYGKKEIKPSDIHPTFINVSLGKKYYTVIEVKMNFRSLPSTFAGQGGRHYVHSGRTDISFRGFVFDETELEVRQKMELYEDMELIENYVGKSLSLLQKEIEEYITEKPKESQNVKKNNSLSLENPFKGLFAGFSEMVNPIKNVFISPKEPDFVYVDLIKTAESSIKFSTFLIYNIYKKTHGMLNI